jgi:tetratricopeptide (TPR) repeat protein
MLELQATTYLNMANAFFQLKRYDKCIEKATLSVNLQKTIKAYYRRGKAYGALEKFEEAAADMKQAVLLNTEDPNDIQKEYVMYSGRAKAAEKQRLQKMQGFLLSDKAKEL